MKLKKLLALLVFVFGAVILSACDFFNGEKKLDLSAKEKFELIQSIETTEQDKLTPKATGDFEIRSGEGDEESSLKGSLLMYAETGDEVNPLLYINVDAYADIYNENVSSTSRETGTVNVMFFLDVNHKAYLNLELNSELDGKETSITFKEVMDVEKFFVDNLNGLNPFDMSLEEFLNSFASYLGIDFDSEIIDPSVYNYDDITGEAKAVLDAFLDLITVSEKNKEKIISFKITVPALKNIVEANAAFFEEMSDINVILENIGDSSYFEYKLALKDNKITKSELDFKLTFFEKDYSGKEFPTTIKINFKTEVQGKKPKLPKSSDLTGYQEVEIFTILEGFLAAPKF